MSLDLERFVVKLQHDYPTDFSNATVAEEAIAEYQRMLVLVQKIPNQPVVPSRLVDLVWHSHILDTQQYARDTLRMFGKYMHHSPSFGGKEEKQELVEQQKKMFASYKREFGEEAKKAMWNPEPKKMPKGVSTKVGGALPDCCSAECVKPVCKGCVGCNDVSCGYMDGEDAPGNEIVQPMNPNRFSGYVPTSDPRPVDVKALNCGGESWCEGGQYKCSIDPFGSAKPRPIPMTLGWTISGDYIYFQHSYGGEAWYGVGLNTISGMGPNGDYIVTMYDDGQGHNNYTGVKDMYKYDVGNGYPCWDVLYQCSVGNTTKGTKDIENDIVTRTAGSTISSWNRKLDTKDSKDHPIGNNKAVVIFAFGYNDEFVHHSGRIECHVNFFTGVGSCF